jgi:D-3-phosphoglycerate dehydrogenase
MIFLQYGDKPGVVGIVGNILGKAGVNIAGMQVARSENGKEALMALTVDSTVAPELVSSIGKEAGATLVRTVGLVS